MRVQAPIVIPGEHFTSPNAGRSLHLTPRSSRGKMKRVGGLPRRQPPTRLAALADLPALGEVKEIAAIRASASPRESFCCEADFNDRNVVESAQ